MTIRFSAKEEANAKSFLKKLILIGDNPSWSDNDVYYHCEKAWYYNSRKDCALDVYAEIVERKFSFLVKNLDNALYKLGEKFAGGGGGNISRGVEQVAQYIAWLCQNNDLVWDDSNQTKYELEHILEDSIFAKTLYEAGCFTSSPAQQAQAATGTRAASTKAAGQPPVNGYKGSGAHSQDIPNLVGTANQKVMKSGAVYCIEADKIGKNTPNAFVTPIKTQGTGTIIKVSKSQAENVMMGSGNGYTDCKLWFDNKNVADAFLLKVQGKYGSKFTNIHVAQAKADANGYFEVSTEFGNALIKANKLNEEMIEALNQPFTEDMDVEPVVDRKSKVFAKMRDAKDSGLIDNIDSYNEALHFCS